MVTAISYSRKGRERKVYEAAPIIKSTVASVHHHPFPFPKEEGVIYGHDHHHQDRSSPGPRHSQEQDQDKPSPRPSPGVEEVPPVILLVILTPSLS